MELSLVYYVHHEFSSQPKQVLGVVYDPVVVP